MCVGAGLFEHPKHACPLETLLSNLVILIFYLIFTPQYFIILLISFYTDNTKLNTVKTEILAKTKFHKVFIFKKFTRNHFLTND